MSEQKVLVVKSSKIQEIRALHAMSELNFPLKVKQKDKLHFLRLMEVFNLKIEICNDDVNTCTGSVLSDSILRIDHKSPRTYIGAIDKPLIFPQCMFEFLRSRWEPKRKYRVSFCGLMTQSRMNSINLWLMNVLKVKDQLSTPRMFERVQRKLYSLINRDHTLIKSFGDFHVLQSNRGRVFPVKAWDDEYYSFLLQSAFVLCPSGDYVWTYRFFEAIMCGAIPIVEEVCDAYEGFLFYKMSDSDFSVNPQWVTHNFNLAKERIAISSHERGILINEFNLKVIEIF